MEFEFSVGRMMDFSPDGRKVAVGLRLAGTVQVFDTVTGKPLAPAVKHPHDLQLTMFNPQGTIVVTPRGSASCACSTPPRCNRSVRRCRILAWCAVPRSVPMAGAWLP